VKLIRDFAKCMGLCLLSLAAWRCDTTETKDPVPSSPIKILAPKNGDRFKATDTVKIITETDYSKVAGNLSAIYSADSGKSWDLVKSAAHHDGLARDTFPFYPPDFGFTAGMQAHLKIKEYGVGGKIAEFGFIHID
jgi:hypothetical protein